MTGEPAYLDVAAVDGIPDGGCRVVAAGGHSILLARLGQEVFALENRCSHAASPMEGGRIRRGRINCPLHGALFDVRTGAPLGGAITPVGLRTFEVSLAEGRVAVRPVPRPGLPA
jgi:nitrite reductase/ring-hydroxylating ferredoxin subunit